MATGKKLVRSKNKVMSGVLGGIADYLDLDPTVVRVVYAVLTFFMAFSGVLLYPLLWLVIPEDQQS